MSYINSRFDACQSLTRLVGAVLICTFISACASKGPLPSAGVGSEQELQSRFRVAIESMQTLKTSAKEPIEAGAFKGNSDLEGIQDNLKSIHQEQPWYPGPILNMGLVSWWLGDVDEAKRYLNKVLSLPERLSEAEDSRELEKKVLLENLDSYSASALNSLGLISRGAGEFDLAEKYYRQALELNSKDKAAIRNLAILLDLYRGQFTKALPLYEQYQSLLDEPDPQVKDWIFDIKNRQ